MRGAWEAQIWIEESVEMVLVKPGIGCAFRGGAPQKCPPGRGFGASQGVGFPQKYLLGTRPVALMLG